MFYPLVVNNIWFSLREFDWKLFFPEHLQQTLSVCALLFETSAIVINFMNNERARLSNNNHFIRQKFMFASTNWIFINDQTKDILNWNLLYFLCILYMFVIIVSVTMITNIKLNGILLLFALLIFNYASISAIYS